MAENEDVMVVTLEFDDGVSEDCEVIGIFDVEEIPDKEYVALMPVEGTDEEDDDVVYLYEYKESGEDEFEMLDIEDDEEFEKVSAAFDRIVEESIED